MSLSVGLRSPLLLVCLCAGLLTMVACGVQNPNGVPELDAGGGTDADPGATKVGCPSCTVLTGARLFDGEASKPGTLVIKDGLIEALVHGPVEISAGKQVDLSGKTVLPGLIDLHVHTAAAAGPGGYSSYDLLHEPHLRSMLRAGVTSYLDLGSSARRIFAYRARIADGVMRGPGLLAAGPLVTASGGHPCYEGSPIKDSCLLIDAAAEASKLDALFADKPDVLKLVIEGGTQSMPLPRVDLATIKAVAAAARAHKVTVVAHVSAAKDVQDALDSGITIFAHMPAYDLMDAQLIARLVKEQAVIIPTAVVYERLYQVTNGALTLDQSALAADVPAGVLAALQSPAYTSYSSLYKAWTTSIWDNVQANLRACVKAGVTLAVGTDAGNPATFHGLAAHRELQLMVAAGLTPARALAAATNVAAKTLGLTDRGALEVGRRADLLVVKGDPLTSIDQTLSGLAAVYLRGEAVDRAGLRQGGKATLTVKQTLGRAEGQVCLAVGECAPGLVCDLWGARCTTSCNAQTGAGCKPGSACFSLSGSAGGAAGYCMLGDGCDLFTQDCKNGAACVWLGNGATSCWYADASKKAGDGCVTSSACARGFQCNAYKGVCYELCHPTDATEGPCSDPQQSCYDLSQLASLPAGQCM